MPSTPAREVNTARIQCAQVIPEIEAVVFIADNILAHLGVETHGSIGIQNNKAGSSQL
jgi:hypothetical protein